MRDVLFLIRDIVALRLGDWIDRWNRLQDARPMLIHTNRIILRWVWRGR